MGKSTGMKALAGAFPRLMVTSVMTQEQFDEVFALFVQSYVPEFIETKFWTRAIMLESTAKAPIEYNAVQYAPTIAELGDRLAKIGGAMILLIQIEAIHDGSTLIGESRLGEFIARFSDARRFVQLDQDGLEYAIIA